MIGLPDVPDPCTPSWLVIVPHRSTVVPGAIGFPGPQFAGSLNQVGVSAPSQEPTSTGVATGLPVSPVGRLTDGVVVGLAGGVGVAAVWVSEVGVVDVGATGAAVAAAGGAAVGGVVLGLDGIVVVWLVGAGVVEVGVGSVAADVWVGVVSLGTAAVVGSLGPVEAGVGSVGLAEVVCVFPVESVTAGVVETGAVSAGAVVVADVGAVVVDSSAAVETGCAVIGAAAVAGAWLAPAPLVVSDPVPAMTMPESAEGTDEGGCPVCAATQSGAQPACGGDGSGADDHAGREDGLRG